MRTVATILDSLDQQTLLGCLKRAQEQIGYWRMVEGLLQARLNAITASPAAQPVEKFLTVGQTAARLGLRKARVYELVRQRQLAKVPGLGSQVRIPASALTNGAKPQ
jgi:excisionase family DNA binding protein